jgi:hypothetical protein
MRLTRVLPTVLPEDCAPETRIFACTSCGTTVTRTVRDGSHYSDRGRAGEFNLGRRCGNGKIPIGNRSRVLPSMISHLRRDRLLNPSRLTAAGWVSSGKAYAAGGHAEVEAIRSMTSRRFPSPWRADAICRAAMSSVTPTAQAFAYVYSRDNATEALQAKILTKDGARRIAINIGKLSEPLGKADQDRGRATPMILKPLRFMLRADSSLSVPKSDGDKPPAGPLNRIPEGQHARRSGILVGNEQQPKVRGKMRKSSLVLLGAVAGAALTLVVVQPRVLLGTSARAAAADTYRQLNLCPPSARAPRAPGRASCSRTRLASRWARASYQAETECQLSPIPDMPLRGSGAAMGHGTTRSRGRAVRAAVSVWEGWRSPTDRDGDNAASVLS